MGAKNLVYVIAPDGGLAESLTGPLQAAGFKTVHHPAVDSLLDSLDGDDLIGCVVAKLGSDALHDLIRKNQVVPVVLWKSNASLAAAVQAVKAGAFDVVERTDALAESVKKALAVQAKYHKLSLERFAANERIRSLTPREAEVFDRLVRGVPKRQIAQELGISPKTLDIHRGNVMFKLETKTAALLHRAYILDRVNPMLLPSVLG